MTKTVKVSLLPDAAVREAFAEASRFRDELYACLTARGEELFELADAVLCAPGAVRSAVELTLLPEHRRGHGGPEFRFAKPETWPEPAVTTRTATANYGKAVAQAWDRVHPRLTHRAAWLDHRGELPLIEGTLIRLEVEHLSKDRAAPAVWLWSSKTGADDTDADRTWQAFPRRFDLEHTFRLFKQTLGWARPRLREPEAADRWTWLIIAACTQLRLARPATRDLRHPWAKSAAPHRLTPATTRAKLSAARRPSSPCDG